MNGRWAIKGANWHLWTCLTGNDLRAVDPAAEGLPFLLSVRPASRRRWRAAIRRGADAQVQGLSLGPAEPVGRHVPTVIALEWKRHLESPPLAAHKSSFSLTVNATFWSARASKAASGTRCSPDRRTRPEKRPKGTTGLVFQFHGTRR